METSAIFQNPLTFFAENASGDALYKMTKDLRTVIRRRLGRGVRMECRAPSSTERIAQVFLAPDKGLPESVQAARMRCTTRKLLETCSNLGWRKLLEHSTHALSKGLQYDATCFAHIFDRGAQLQIIEKAMKVAFESRFKSRFHCLLYGPPGGSKTEVLRSIRRMLGQEMVLELDATSTTKAGAERALIEAEPVPPVLLIEELEKVEPEHLRWLLSVLDQRAEVSKTNHAVGCIRKASSPLCLAVTNDLEKVEACLAGALASRFSHKIYFPAPDRALLERILQRDLHASGGDPRWIAPALDYCLEIEKTFDPRRAIAVCQTGRDDLLTGKFQEVLRQTSRFLRNAKS